MDPAAQFVLFLIALIIFVIGAIWPLFRPGPTTFSETNAVSLGLALVCLVWVLTAGHAAF